MMRVDLDAFHAWPSGPVGAAASDGKHAITDEAWKERREDHLTGGSHVQ